MPDRDEEFTRLVGCAREAPEVLGLFVFGSRATDDGLADERSDYDVGVVVSDGEGAAETFARRWPYRHGADVEVVIRTVSELRVHAEYESESEWARPLYSRVN